MIVAVKALRQNNPSKIVVAVPVVPSETCSALGEHADDPYKALVERVGNARVVLIGEASHGTHEFYHERAEITRLLIEQKGFAAVAVEADWPDALRVNRYVSGTGDDSDAADALAGFRRFPTWMWRNADVLDFVGWLRDFNESRARRSRLRKTSVNCSMSGSGDCRNNAVVESSTEPGQHQSLTPRGRPTPRPPL